MFDLLAMAFQTDLTRVFTFMMSREAQPADVPEIGVADPWHVVSHHGDQAGEDGASNAKVNVVCAADVRAVPREAAGRRPTATARCSITR